jgi:hypothetical protein
LCHAEHQPPKWLLVTLASNPQAHQQLLAVSQQRHHSQRLAASNFGICKKSHQNVWSKIIQTPFQSPPWTLKAHKQQLLCLPSTTRYMLGNASGGQAF